MKTEKTLSHTNVTSLVGHSSRSSSEVRTAKKKIIILRIFSGSNNSLGTAKNVFNTSVKELIIWKIILFLNILYVI